jgi:hypothetical protein
MSITQTDDGGAQPVQVMIKPWRDRVIMMTLTGPAGNEPRRIFALVVRNGDDESKKL